MLMQGVFLSVDVECEWVCILMKKETFYHRRFSPIVLWAIISFVLHWSDDSDGDAAFTLQLFHLLFRLFFSLHLCCCSQVLFSLANFYYMLIPHAITMFSVLLSINFRLNTACNEIVRRRRSEQNVFGWNENPHKRKYNEHCCKRKKKKNESSIQNVYPRSTEKSTEKKEKRKWNKMNIFVVLLLFWNENAVEFNGVFSTV